MVDKTAMKLLNKKKAVQNIQDSLLSENFTVIGLFVVFC